MSGATYSVEIDDKGFKSVMQELQKRAKELTPAMRIIAEVMRTSVVKNFEEEGRPKWKPLSIATLFAGRAKKYVTKSGRYKKGIEEKLRGRMILTNTARLRNSIAGRAFADSAEVGTNVVYAAIHQFGGKAGRNRKVNIPARPFLMIQDEDVDEAKRAIARHMTEGL